MATLFRKWRGRVNASMTETLVDPALHHAPLHGKTHSFSPVSTHLIQMNRKPFSAPFEIIKGDLSNGLVLLADHASNALPDEYGDLGLPEAEFRRHIAYDIGVEATTRRLAELTEAPAVMAGFSRLLIDPNRGPDDPTLIRQLYDGTIVPGNYPISAQERKKRLEAFYQPYHASVAEMISSVEKESGAAPLVISIHSFTPSMQGRTRPWHIGILWDRDDRAVEPLFRALSGQPDLVVGDNEPYDGAMGGDTMNRHCTANGNAHALIEIRQDLVADALGAAEWAERLAPVLDAINARSDIHEARLFGSRAI